MNKTSIMFLLIIFALTTGLFAMGSDDADFHSDQENQAGLEVRRLQVVATTSIIGDVVGNIVGDTAELNVLMPLGQNPHSYTPTPRGLTVLEEADIVFVNGLDLEEELMPILQSLDNTPVVEVSAGITTDHEDHPDEQAHDDHHHEEDPHFWFSPANVIHWSENISHALSAADPHNAEIYERSAAAYVAKLENLDEEVRTMVEKIPSEDRKLVMDHVAIGYYAQDYGFDVIGNIIPTFSDQSEPSARQIAELVEVIEHDNIKAIFVGETTGRNTVKMAETVADEIKRDLPVVSILTGSLASTGSRGDTYIDFIRLNSELITEALTK